MYSATESVVFFSCIFLLKLKLGSSVDDVSTSHSNSIIYYKHPALGTKIINNTDEELWSFLCQIHMQCYFSRQYPRIRKIYQPVLRSNNEARLPFKSLCHSEVQHFQNTLIAFLITCMSHDFRPLSNPPPPLLGVRWYSQVTYTQCSVQNCFQ